MKDYFINGIQQVGIGVNDIYPAWQWYIDHFHFDLPIFDEEAIAALMLPYTNGQPRNRHAVLALNYQGGGGLEIWNHTSFLPKAAIHEIIPGDLGISTLIIKVKNIQTSYDLLKSRGVNILSGIYQDETNPYFFVSDPYGNLLKICTSSSWHKNKNLHSGGVLGCSVGVTNMATSLLFYQDILGYDQIVHESAGPIESYTEMGYSGNYHKIIITHSKPRNGAFSKLLGNSQIELIQSLDRQPNKIYQDRMWGELGYIHLCFDVEKMNHLKAYCESKGHPFTVDSGESFDMGEAAGRFAYTEDPDGTLIEFVETHKIPILKKLGLYYNLRNKPTQTPLPNHLLTAMGLTRVKNVLQRKK